MSRPTWLLAEFAGADGLLAAARQARAAGYARLEAYAPCAVPGLDEALGLGETGVPPLMLAFGTLGGTGAFLLQAYLAAVDYPLNAGGRPFFSWPPFVLVAFELTVLGAALAGFIGMLALNGLPRLHHPVFEAPGFERCSQDRYFLALGTAHDPAAARAFLEGLGALAVREVDDVH